MKKSLIFLLCAVLAGIVFFACSDNSLDSSDLGIKKEQTLVPCYIPADGKCFSVSRDVCKAIDGEHRTSCDLAEPSSSSELDQSSSSSGDETDPSSSSESEDSSSSVVVDVSSSSVVVDVSSSSVVADVSSSSVVVGGSSSSVVVGGSSSSVVPSSSSSSISNPNIPGTTGEFRFRNFNYPSTSNGTAYLIGSSMHVSGTVTGGTSQLLNSLSINNATAAGCGAITVEIEGGGLTTIAGEPNITRATEAGLITARAVATCNGEKVVLKTAIAEVVAPPIEAPKWECSIPQYVGRTENIRTFLTLKIDERDNPNRCGAVSYTSVSPPNLTVGTANLSITASVSCTGTPAVPSPETCAKTGVSVVENYVKFDRLDQEKEIQVSGTTVIDFSNISADKFGCKGVSNSSTFNFRLNNGSNIKGTSAQKEGNDYWIATDIPVNAAANGNRFIINVTETTTTNRSITCLIAEW